MQWNSDSLIWICKPVELVQSSAVFSTAGKQFHLSALSRVCSFDRKYWRWHKAVDRGGTNQIKVADTDPINAPDQRDIQTINCNYYS